MRISDWSSDVCSSDLFRDADRHRPLGRQRYEMFSGFGTRPKSQALPVIQRAQVGRRANNAETLTRELNYGNRQSRVGRSLGFDQREARICEFDVHRRPAYQLLARSQHRDLTEVVKFDASDISVYGRGDATYCHG